MRPSWAELWKALLKKKVVVHQRNAKLNTPCHRRKEGTFVVCRIYMLMPHR